MKKLLKNAQIVNEGSIEKADVLLSGGRILKIDVDISYSYFTK